MAGSSTASREPPVVAPLICCGLRKRPDWASLAPALLRANAELSWKPEVSLGTHDVAVPLPGTAGSRRRILRAILLSPADIGTDESRSRIERLRHLNGGQDSVIVFLLKPGTAEQESPVSGLMKLQLELVGELEMPIIPVDSISAVPASLGAFCRQMSTSSGSREMANPVRSLLPYCSDKPPLSEHEVHVLTDITSDLRHLLDTVSTPAGQARMAEFLGGGSERAISFWEKEYLVE
ncbi:hypothetical protein GGS23DRAFT_593651 [Durotheca rogersii]|uniref:uncharacterized protein n=1 Tax=Durotheca rogersii TaxID=419775 RepID=UPI00221E9C3E|nr:uncharacterized protein GGS23DRAFT_593651 [Durotheca rogersii]KAI5866918.1 hypothetical protein GGS23DRAFT_593651 [Durotheca rogersii]